MNIVKKHFKNKTAKLLTAVVSMSMLIPTIGAVAYADDVQLLEEGYTESSYTQELIPEVTESEVIESEEINPQDTNEEAALQDKKDAEPARQVAQFAPVSNGTVTSEAELEAAIAGTETEIKIGKSFDVAETIEIDREVTIDLGGNKITYSPDESSSEMFLITADDVVLTGGTLTTKDSKGARAITVENAADVTIEGLTIEKFVCNAKDGGGALYVDENSDVYLDAVDFNNNEATGHGGAIYVAGDIAIAYDKDRYTTISYNTAGRDGGGIYLKGALMADIEDDKKYAHPTISGNRAGGNGGGVCLGGNESSTQYSFSFIDISGNEATNGGGIGYDNANADASWGGLEVLNCVISGNIASDSGGGIMVPMNGGATVQLTEISGNKAQNYGGGICTKDSEPSQKLEIDGCEIKENKAFNDSGTTSFGGGIYTTIHTTISVSDDEKTKINGNSSHNGGGVAFAPAISAQNPDIAVSYQTVEITGNFAYLDAKKTGGNGAGIYHEHANVLGLNMYGSNIDGNIADSLGGGIYIEGGASITETNDYLPTTVTDNKAIDGGGIYALAEGESITIDISNTEILSNTAELRGGGINLASGSLEVRDATIEGNGASSGGGIYTYDWEEVVTKQMTFATNTADFPVIELLGSLEDTHENKILKTVFTEPFTHAYNNCDINNTQMYRVNVISENGGTATSNVRLASPDTKVELTANAGAKYSFNKWSTSDVSVDSTTSAKTNFVMPEQDVTVIASWTKDSTGGGGGGGGSKVKPKPEVTEPTLDKENHFAYVAGYTDGTVKPENNITRAEVAAIFYRLLTDSSRDDYWATMNSFPDVAADVWYNTSVSTMANAKIVSGYDDGMFRGENFITRAEFASIAARFDSSSYSGEDKFTDITNHWAANHINRAAQKGWISGYPDGTFKPEQYITRAEAVSMINRVLERHKITADGMLEDMIIWPDNVLGDWYYEAIQEATNGHEYTRDDSTNYEEWTELISKTLWGSK